MDLSTVTIGADPEVFLKRKDSGELKSAIDVVGGIKSSPQPLGRAGFFVQEDNVAAEFNIPPAKTCEEFASSITWSLAEIHKRVDSQGYTLAIQASGLFPPIELEDPRSLHFGCDPDYNAWKGGERNPRPRSANDRLRSCGGHIHVGYPANELDRIRLIKLMDLYLGVPSVMMDEDVMRRRLYGKAGAFRPQKHGVEYRTLSNFWLRSQELSEWAYNQTMRAVQKCAEFGWPQGMPPIKDKFDEFMEKFDLMDEIQKCINSGDVELSAKLIANYDLVTV